MKIESSCSNPSHKTGVNFMNHFPTKLRASQVVLLVTRAIFIAEFYPQDTEALQYIFQDTRKGTCRSTGNVWYYPQHSSNYKSIVMGLGFYLVTSGMLNSEKCRLPYYAFLLHIVIPLI